MLKERRRLHSQENFTLKIGGQPTRRANKKELRVKGEVVRFKMDVECSADLAERFLNECLSFLKESRQSRLLEAKARVSPTKPVIPPSNAWPASRKRGATSAPDHTLRLSKWKGRLLCSLFLVAVLSLSSLVGHTYLEYHKKQESKHAKQKATKALSQLFEAFVAQKLEALLAKLDELTAIQRMRRAFPEITSLPAIARFKRGPDLTTKANATVELLWRVKNLFDAWTRNSHQFPPQLRPTKQEIALFLNLWTDTELLLDQLERAKQSSLNFSPLQTDEGPALWRPDRKAKTG